MSLRSLLVASVTINVAFIGWSFVRSDTPPTSVPEARSIPQKSAPRPTSQRVEVVMSPSENFTWTKLEAEDYRQYIANLRAVGCPEETIRDILTADINKLYARKIASLGQALRDFKYWQPGTSRTRTLAENRHQLAGLNREKWNLLGELLGIDAESEFRKNNPATDYLNDELTLGFLPDSKRNRVREPLDRYQELEQEVLQRAGTFSRNHPEVVKLQQQRLAELATILTPAELEEYELRSSSLAETLRNRLAGANLSEQQFRQLYQAQKQFDSTFSSAALAGPQARAQMEARTSAQRQLDDQFRGILGDQAFRDYKRMQDSTYRGLTEVARDFSLPQMSVDKVYDIKQAVESSVRQIFSDQSLNAEQRAAALKTITDETQRALVELMGQKAFDAYRQNSGQWIPSDNGETMVFTTRSDSGETMAVRAFRIDSGNGVRSGQPGGGATGGGGGSQQFIVVPPR